jgi:hypothetical protein
MKIFTFSIAIILCITTSFVSTQNTNNGDCQTIVDSANAFIQTSESAINTKPTIKDNERNLKLDKWLQKLSFKDLSCLLDNKSIPLKATGFVYAANFYGDSLLKNYSYLLTDTTTVQFFRADGNASPKMKLGELLSMMTQKVKEDKGNFARRPEIEETVSIFIKKYSTYPDTYKPHSFPDFSMGSDNEGLSDFKISHDYEIKNNEGKNVRVVSAFVFDKNLRLNVIEKDSSSYISSYPPKLDYWLKAFGRQLTKSDSLALGLR